MTQLADQGFLDLGNMRLEYRMIGPRPEAAPTIVLLHEGLRSAAIRGGFADDLAAATGPRVLAYSRPAYANPPPPPLPHTVPFPRRAPDVATPSRAPERSRRGTDLTDGGRRLAGPPPGNGFSPWGAPLCPAPAPPPHAGPPRPPWGPAPLSPTGLFPPPPAADPAN